MKNYVKMFESWVLSEEAEYGTKEAAGTFSEQVRMLNKMTAADFTRLGRKKSGDLIADLIGYLVPSGAFQKEKQTIRYNESTGAFEWSPNPERAWNNFGLKDRTLRGGMLTLGLPEIAMNTKPFEPGKGTYHPTLYNIDSIGNYPFAACPILYVTHYRKSSNDDEWALADASISIAELLECMTNSLIDGAWTDIDVFIPKKNSSDWDSPGTLNKNLKARMEIIKRGIWPSVYRTLTGMDTKKSSELAKKIQRPIGDYDSQGQLPGAKMNAYNP